MDNVGDIAFPDPPRETKSCIIGLPGAIVMPWLSDAINGATLAMRDFHASMEPWVTKKNLRKLRRIDRRARKARTKP